MKPNALAIALVTAAATFPATSHAADDVCSRLFIYAVNQLCQLLPNGQSLCQPVGLAGPSPSCESPSHPAMVQIPLGPPVIQIPQFPSFAPQPYAGNPFGVNPFAPNPYAPAAAYFPNPTLPTLPYQAPMPNAAAPKELLPATVSAATKPVADEATKNIPETSATAEVSAPAALAAPVPETTTASSPAAPAETASAVPAAVPAPTPLEPIATAPAPVAEPSTPAAPVAAPPVATTPDTPSPAAATSTKDTVTAVTATHEANPSVSPATAEQIIAPVAPLGVDDAVRATAATPTSVDQSKHATAAAETTPAAPSMAPAIAMPATVGSQPAEPALPEKAVPSTEDALAHFEFDSAELTPVGRAMLDAWIKQASGNVPIVVTGHADRLGPEPYNEKLSLLRAEAVKNYLASKGKTAKRIVILGKGEKVPLVECSGDATPETKSCLAPNRRAEIALKPVVKRARKVATKPARYPVAK